MLEKPATPLIGGGLIGLRRFPDEKELNWTENAVGRDYWGSNLQMYLLYGYSGPILKNFINFEEFTIHS